MDRRAQVKHLLCKGCKNSQLEIYLIEESHISNNTKGIILSLYQCMKYMVANVMICLITMSN